nr:hypothetical protein [Tanacetum cinerariifolium]
MKEAVNTACYMQNRVLEVKPHNKNPYELLHGKFNGKADEGFFVRYSFNNKAFRVFNSRTRIVEENFHIRFSKNTPNVIGSGPDWIFDIDALTRTMNYEPIVVGTQSNDYADLKSSHDDGFKPSSYNGKKVDEDPSKGNECTDQEKKDNVNITNNVNTVSSIVNVSDINNDNELPFDPNMSALEDVGTFDFSNEDEDMDVKSAFLHEKIKEEVYVYQPPTFEDPYFSDRVYKFEKALYGLHQAPKAWHKGDILLVQVYVDDIIFGLNVKQKNDGIFISQDKYVAEILKKFGFTEVKNACTPIETQKPLLKDKDGKEEDVHMYKSMIGSLMYLTSLRPGIMFVVCARAKYQVNPKVSHLLAVKRIFGYLKGQPKLGLWYLKDSPFDLVAYTNSDYAEANLDRKSTTGEAEYVAASSCCGQVIWIQNQLLDYGRHLRLAYEEGVDCLPNSTIFENLKLMGKPKRKVTEVPQPNEPAENVADEAVYKELDDRLVRVTTTASSLEAKKVSGYIDKTQSKTTPNEASSPRTTLGGGLRCQEAMTDTIAQIRRVKKLEKKQRLRTHKLKRVYKVGLTARLDSYYDDQSLSENASKQGRKFQDIDADEDITLVNDQDDAEMFDVSDLQGKEVFVEKELIDKEVNDEVQKVVVEVVEDINTAKLIVNAAHVSAVGEDNVTSIATNLSAAMTITTNEITLAQELVEIKTSKPKAKGIVLQEPSESTTTTKTISSKKSQDKGKAITIKEPVNPIKEDQIRLDEEAALKLQAELQAEFGEEQRLKRRMFFAAKAVEEKRNKPTKKNHVYLPQECGRKEAQGFEE